MDQENVSKFKHSLKLVRMKFDIFQQFRFLKVGIFIFITKMQVIIVVKSGPLIYHLKGLKHRCQKSTGILHLEF
jgi:hypothetical protein